jgi:hypothetical protein
MSLITKTSLFSATTLAGNCFSIILQNIHEKLLMEPAHTLKDLPLKTLLTANLSLTLSVGALLKRSLFL